MIGFFLYLHSSRRHLYTWLRFPTLENQKSYLRYLHRRLLERVVHNRQHPEFVLKQLFVERKIHLQLFFHQIAMRHSERAFSLSLSRSKMQVAILSIFSPLTTYPVSPCSITSFEPPGIPAIIGFPRDAASSTTLGRPSIFSASFIVLFGIIKMSQRS